MFSIHINTLQEEFYRVCDTIGWIPFFLENYGEIIARLPKDENGNEAEFLEKLKDLILNKKIDPNKVDFAEFENDMRHYYQYDILNSLKNDIEIDLEKYQDTINANQIFKTLNQNWGFKIFDNYKIILTYYGPGGSYNYKTGEIIIRYKIEVKKPYFYTIFHEAIHIGIEKNIIRKYNLSQQQKESIVDAMCSRYLPNYAETGLQDITKKDLGLYNFLMENSEVMEKNLIELLTKYI